MVREMMGGTYYSSTTSSSGGGCGGDGGDMMNIEKPAWLERLMAETFFGDCGVHRNRRKNEKNIFCLHCCLSICPHCFPSHRSHPLLQVLYQFQILIRFVILTGLARDETYSFVYIKEKQFHQLIQFNSL